MKNITRITLFLFIVTAVTGLNSCNEETSKTEPEVLKTSIADYSNLISSFTLESEDELISTDAPQLKSSSLSNCFNIAVQKNADGEFWPRNWTVEYLGGDCSYFSGNTKKGKINISLSDFWKNQGSLRTVTFEDYYFNDNKLAGVKTILNNGLNENGHLSFTKTVKNASLSYSDGSTLSWECEKICELTTGGDTFIFADDAWSVTGSGQGVNLDKQNYSITITSPLIYKNGCFYPVSGVVEINTEDTGLQIIDYGDGECDNLAKHTAGGITTNIEL